MFAEIIGFLFLIVVILVVWVLFLLNSFTKSQSTAWDYEEPNILQKLYVKIKTILKVD